MTSSLDVAGLIPAVAAAVQAAATVVQMYWGRRRRTAETMQKPAAPQTVRNRRNNHQAVIVRVHLCSPSAGEVAVSVRIDGSAGGMALELSKEHHAW
ncbi:hypothetical protein ACIRD6_36895 [Streptomyces sp. NPDC102473]|uniref:hypothetical protein n=1 Tax=Streptomyces sp. NPDC102473 TaxID=3366180 RepID=UPI00382DD70B